MSEYQRSYDYQGFNCGENQFSPLNNIGIEEKSCFQWNNCDENSFFQWNNCDENNVIPKFHINEDQIQQTHQFEVDNSSKNNQTYHDYLINLEVGDTQAPEKKCYSDQHSNQSIKLNDLEIVHEIMKKLKLNPNIAQQNQELINENNKLVNKDEEDRNIHQLHNTQSKNLIQQQQVQQQQENNHNVINTTNQMQGRSQNNNIKSIFNRKNTKFLKCESYQDFCRLFNRKSMFNDLKKQNNNILVYVCCNYSGNLKKAGSENIYEIFYNAFEKMDVNWVNQVNLKIPIRLRKDQVDSSQFNPNWIREYKIKQSRKWHYLKNLKTIFELENIKDDFEETEWFKDVQDKLNEQLQEKISQEQEKKQNILLKELNTTKSQNQPQRIQILFRML